MLRATPFLFACAVSSAAMGLAGAAIASPGSERPLEVAETVTKTLDMHMRSARPEQIILINVYDTLYRDIGNPPELTPWLAESHTVSDDGLTWTFKLRDGIKFHDGSEMTAEDVVYSFQRLLTVGQQPAGAFKPVLKPENVTAEDEHTIKFVLDKPYAPFLATIPLVAIVNKDLVQEHEKDGDWGAAWLTENDAGSGAYMVEPGSYEQEDKITLVRFKDHFKGWDDNPDPIDTVRQVHFQEAATRMFALEKGDMHMGSIELPPEQIARLEKAGLTIDRSENMRLFVIPFNTTKAPLDNVNFRRCISHAFNYQAFVDTIMQGSAVRNPAPIPRNLWGFPEGYEGITYDMEKAKEECDKARAAGAPVESEIVINVLGYREQTVLAAQIWQSELRKLGVNLKIIPENWASMTSAATKAETSPMLWTHWVSTYFVDPENWIGQMYDSSYHGTWKASSYYSTPETDALLDKARTTSDQEERAALYEEAAIKIAEAAPSLFVSNELAVRPMDSRLAGYKFSPAGSGADFRWMHWEK